VDKLLGVTSSRKVKAEGMVFTEDQVKRASALECPE